MKQRPRYHLARNLGCAGGTDLGLGVLGGMLAVWGSLRDAVLVLLLNVA